MPVGQLVVFYLALAEGKACLKHGSLELQALHVPLKLLLHCRGAHEACKVLVNRGGGIACGERGGPGSFAFEDVVEEQVLAESHK